ncbi:protein unc-13 homolog C-like [Achroia grisella]|uniref:protein unc-13 homolog C-like n=1 Tax=Achroia grisella TaxID=688607 RepID=UPI0027D3296B|nr:protein unc-13 homolog C-like [Achroia grisella]
MDTLHNTMAGMLEHFNKTMADFKSQLEKARNTPTTISSLESEFDTFRSFTATALTNLQKQVELVARQQDQMEMRSRRKILLLHGVTESQKENVAQVLSKVVIDRLQIDDFSADQIRRCSRLGRSIKDKPRPILVKFRDLDIKDEIWHSKTKLKGTGITMSEFLTATRHSVFMAARQLFGIKKCWTQDGFIIVAGEDGTRHRISSTDELNQLMSLSPPPAVHSVSTPNNTKDSGVITTRSKRHKK